jgi:propionyl-CoA synthetase
VERYQQVHAQSLQDRDGFWRAKATLIDWQQPFSSVLDYSRPPFARWFVGGTTNLCHNAVDRHLATRGDQAALVYISTETGNRQTYSFRELYREVNRWATILRELGVGRGDRVLIYMPMVAEAVFAILATVRIGAIHSVVFGGFASASLATRIDDARPALLITADAGMRGGRMIPYKPLVDGAIALARHPPPRVLIVDRGLDSAITRVPGRDVDFAPMREKHMDANVPCVWMESRARVCLT